MAKHPTQQHDEPDEPVTAHPGVADHAAAAEAEPAKKEPPKPEHPMRSALLAALRNAGMTGEQAEAVVKAFEDYLSAGTKH